MRASGCDAPKSDIATNVADVPLLADHQVADQVPQPGVRRASGLWTPTQAGNAGGIRQLSIASLNKHRLQR